MKHILQYSGVLGLALVVATCSAPSSASADLIDGATADYFTISDAGLASNGLHWLSSSFGLGETYSADAIANGVSAGFTDARLPTIAEWNDLFAAADIGGVNAADAFATGPDLTAANNDPDVDVLAHRFGLTQPGFRTLFWTDPDGNDSNASTRDVLQLFAGTAIPGTLANDLFFDQSSASMPSSVIAYPLVANTTPSAAAVPEPSSMALLGLGCLGFGAYRRRRKDQEPASSDNQ